MENSKLYNPVRRIPIELTSNASEKEGATETERGMKRKQNPNDHKSYVRKEKQARGESYSPQKSKSGENKARILQIKWVLLAQNHLIRNFQL